MTGIRTHKTATHDKEDPPRQLRNPLLKGEALENHMLNLFKDEIGELEGLSKAAEPIDSTEPGPKSNNASNSGFSEITKLRQAYYNFDRDAAEREAEARRDELEAAVYYSRQAQKKQKDAVLVRYEDDLEEKVRREMGKLKLEEDGR